MKIILIVDDNKELRNLFKLMLQDYEAEEAENGLEALKKIQEKDFNLILMDILMPEMDGIVTTKKILELKPDTKIVAITAYSSKAAEIIQAGAKEVLKKPIRKHVLINKVEEYIDE